MRLAAILMVLLSAQHALAVDCEIAARDDAWGIHTIVEACRNIGTFSVGAQYDGSWEKLSFQYPMPWKGTYSTFYIE